MIAASTGKRDTVVIGASAGGVSALQQLLPAFSASHDASIFIVLHLPAEGNSVLDQVLGRKVTLEIGFARDGEPIAPRRIYLAPPDRHLLLEDDRIKLWRGAMENHSRPAIDPLFRSAAVARRGRVIGAVLSGLLDDGAAGLLSVKRCGGLAFVQSPDEAAESEMPLRAAQSLASNLDAALPAAELGKHIAALLGSPAPPGDVPDDIHLEMKMLLGQAEGIAVLSQRYPPVPISCPDCGGPLWAIHDGRLQRFRCHTGHAFGLDSLLSSQDNHIEQALWAAIKGLEQRSQLLINLAHDATAHYRPRATRYLEESERLKAHARTLRDVLLASFQALSGAESPNH
jgi:two-component system chemotaxis response regulator CheB